MLLPLTKLLYEKGYSKKQILELYSFVDWVLTLPEALEKIFLEDLRTYEKEKKMPYITSAERLGRKEGRHELYMETRRQTSIKVDPKAWDAAKIIFKEYNLTVSDAINIFLSSVRTETSQYPAFTRND